MPRTSLRAPMIRAAVVAATAAAALVTTVPAGPATATGPAPVPAETPTTADAAPATTPLAAAQPLPAPAPATGALFPAPAAPTPAGPATAPVPTVSAPVQPVAQVVPTAARSTAMSRALTKVGAPYRWGAAGPNAFDCSGLVTWAFKGTGVSLPRSSRAMSQVGSPVSRADLRPGDLVFFYRPVSHVGIYIGNGKIVHASSRKSPVKVSDMGRMKFTTARRV